MPLPILNVPFDLIGYPDVLSRIEDWRNSGRRSYVSLVNPFSVIQCMRDPAMFEAIRAAGAVLPDGIGITLAAEMLGHPHKGRVAGPSLMLYLCDQGRQYGYRHFFYGATDAVNAALTSRLTAQFPGINIVGTLSPPFGENAAAGDAADIARINQAQPDLVWVGLGTSKQERWMFRNRAGLEATTLLGVGAAFDFHAGRVPWAPRWVRAAGLEWAFRLACEPGRLWRRDMESFLFLLQVLRFRLSTTRQPWNLL